MDDSRNKTVARNVRSSLGEKDMEHSGVLRMKGWGGPRGKFSRHAICVLLVNFDIGGAGQGHAVFYLFTIRVRIKMPEPQSSFTARDPRFLRYLYV